MANDTLTDDSVAARATYAPGALHPSDWAAIWLASFILIVLVLTYLVTWIRRAMSVDKFSSYTNPDQSSYTTIFTLHSEDIEEDLPNTGIDNSGYLDDESEPGSRPVTPKRRPSGSKGAPSGTKSGPSGSGGKRGSIGGKSNKERKSEDKVTLEDEKKPIRPGRPKRQYSQEKRPSQRKTSPDKKRGSKKRGKKP